MKRKAFYILLMACTLYACKSNRHAYQKPDTGLIGPNVTNYRETVSWAGTYTGTVPCADCPGIEWELTLNPEMTYTMHRTYIDRGYIAPQSGKFTWNAAGTQIDLLDIGDRDGAEHFLVLEDKLILLTPDGEIPSHTNLQRYTLTKNKKSAPIAGLTLVRWKLVEIMGRPVSYPEGATNEAFIYFKTDGTLNGNLGCNRFSGNYTAGADQHIRFSNIVNTLTMCLDMRTEDDLKQILNTVDTYQLMENRLVLNRARMAPLAIFELAGDL
jgi:heat shock protein HslJ